MYIAFQSLLYWNTSENHIATFTMALGWLFVSILVVLEYLWEWYRKKSPFSVPLQSFNPCCIGIPLRISADRGVQVLYVSFNPCCIGIPLRMRQLSGQGIAPFGVSILVVLEYLWESWTSRPKPNCYKYVSILVVLEYLWEYPALWPVAVPCGVSILVVLEYLWE